LAASSLASEHLRYLTPETLFAPSVVAVVDRLPRPKLLLGQVPPRSTTGVNPKHPLDHRTVVPPSPTMTSVSGQQRLYASPLDVGQMGGHRRGKGHHRCCCCCGLGLHFIGWSSSKKVALGGVATLGNRLMGTAPQRPSHSKLPLFFGSCHRQDKATHLRNGRRDQLEVATIPLLASTSRASWASERKTAR
jgi:hypothetical protein